MKILIAAASISSELSGVQRHAFNAARCLLTHPDVSAVHLVVAPWQRGLAQNSGLEPGPRLTFHMADMQSSALSRNLWYYRSLPQLAATLGADVVHLAYPVPLNARAFSCPTVVTLHDLYPYQIPSNFGFPKVFFNRWILQQCLRSVGSIACVSDVTLRQLSSYVPHRTQQKALRIYNCVEPVLECAVRSPIRDWTGERFLLCVAQHRSNKNIPFLLEVFDRLIRRKLIDSSMQLVLIGISGPETGLIQRTIERAGLGRNVCLMEGLSDAQLQWCYRNCEAVLAPSKIEGFGLPVVEALLAGCPVVCSDIPAFRELGGDHCRYVPLDAQAQDAFAEAIVATLKQDMRRDPIAMPQLSASVIAGLYMGLYFRLLGSAGLAQNFLRSTSVNAAGAERQSQ
jgi:glycosyltransferase involved in cell wall biosynthesis